MTTAELLNECKKGLNIPEATTAFDGVLTQKILAVKNYAKNAGVVDAQLDTDAGVGLVVMGVADLWIIQGGEAKFSPAFNTILTQIACKSYTITE
jgi:hypothetical protein